MSDAILPGDPESPLKTEDVELWVIKDRTGHEDSYVLRTERGEKVSAVLNQIDQSPLMLDVILRDDVTNAVSGHISYIIANCISFSKVTTKRAIYPKGESPAEKELAMHKAKSEERAAAFERLQAAKEADFQRELEQAEKGF